VVEQQQIDRRADHANRDQGEQERSNGSQGARVAHG
jgi:hypothetical protein